MFVIPDGRSHFYQWDIGQCLQCTDLDEGTEVHFASCSDRRALAEVAKTYQDGDAVMVDVPDVILQHYGDIAVYIYSKADDAEGHVAKAQFFYVKARKKPADYIYAEGAQLPTWVALDERITALEELGKQGLVWEDVWDSSAMYNAGEVVHHNGSAWVCVGTEVAEGVEPGTDTESWALLASKGDGGLTDTEKTLILSLFKNAVFTSDVSAILAQLETLWSSSEDGGGDSGGTDTPTLYIVTNKLTNVTNSNSAASVTSGNSYTATLTVADGCDMESVKVTMGGTDITEWAYSGGVVTIASVTGNVVITAVARSASDITQDGNTLIIVAVPNVTQNGTALIIE